MTQMESTPQQAGELLGKPGYRDFALREHRSLWGDAWRRLLRSPGGRIGLVIVVLFLIATLLTRLFWEYNPRTDLDYNLKLKAPNLVATEEVSSIHPFGTDKLGRDIFRRVAHGGWNSLRVGLVAVGISLLIGGLLGLVAGFYETMPLQITGRIVLFGGIGLLLGALITWLAGHVVPVILFTLLGVVAAYLEDWLAGDRRRIAAFAGTGLVIGVGSGLVASPMAGLVCGMLGLITGAVLGMELRGPVVANAIMRVMDIILAFPGILLAIAIVAMLGPGLDKGMIAIGFVGIPVYARLVRASVLSVMQAEYVTAGLSVGVGQGRILFRHVVPNTLSPIIVQSTMGLASAILWAGALGFLGLGAIPPEPEWGAMLGDSYRFMTTGAWWAVVFPGLAIMLSVLGFNLLGDGLRDALDPRLQA
jgi:peptide/nickel transport system permease protein